MQTKVMLAFLVLLGILGFVIWPYAVVYRLDRALLAGDNSELEKLLDLHTIRQQFKQQLDRNIEGYPEQLANLVLHFLRGGVREKNPADCRNSQLHCQYT